MTTTKTPIKDIAADLAAAHARDPLVIAAGPSPDDADTFDFTGLRAALAEGGWVDVNHWHIETLRIHLRSAIRAEADFWADVQAEKATAARVDAALKVLKEASSGQSARCVGGAVYQPDEIATWVAVDDDGLKALGASVLAGEDDAYSLWAAQCGDVLSAPRDMPAETAIEEAQEKGFIP